MVDINKKDIIQLLEEIALYLEIKGENPFRISAYRKAAQALEKDVRSLTEIDDFSKLPGIGKGSNEIIVQFLESGKSDVLEALKEEVPSGLIPLLQLPGLGGKRIASLYKELNIVDEASLKAACEDGSIEKVRGFGKKTVANIMEALENKQTRPDRLPISFMLGVAEKIQAQLVEMTGIDRYSLAGSLRRLRETVKDIDFIIATTEGEKVREQLVNMDGVTDIIANGDKKVSVTFKDKFDVNIDFRLVDEKEYSTSLHHFTGSMEHNIRMRQIAKERGEKINEYGVEVEETGELLQFASEEEFFQHFGLHYIPPELREDRGEVEAFQKDLRLLELDDIRGDLHMHTSWSDGAESVEEMVAFAHGLGYEYISITDHSKYLRVANGLNETRLRQQWEEIDRVQEQYPDIKIFKGIEMDILPDGTLDFEDDFLRELDLVIGAIHSSFDQTEEEIMHRLTTALENPYVDIIAHPTGRLIGRRDGYRVNMEILIEKAKETNTALELNANPMRFDLNTAALKLAKENGVPIAINTDAHRTGTFHHMDYGVKMGRKAYLEKSDVINTWDLAKLRAFINRNK